MFALLVPPRPLLMPAQMQTISPTQSAYVFPASPAFSHLSFFMLPDTSLPPRHLAGIYIRFPGASEFTLLGALGPEKQSAIFRVSGLKPNAGTGNQGQQWGDGMIVGEVGGVAEVEMDAAVNATAGAAAPAGDVTLGISIEPAEQLAPQLAALQAKQQQQHQQQQGGQLVPATGAAAPGQTSTKVLAQRIIKNAFNFLASFEGGDGMIPLKSFEGWWKKFERRVEMDPGFLEKDDQG